MDTEAMLELFDNTVGRWRLTGEQRADIMLQGPLVEVASLMGAISLGLGAIFEESERAEIHWLQTPRTQLDGKTPLQYLTGNKNGMVRVLRLVESEQNLR